MTQPTVYLMIAGEAIAFDESDEVVATSEFTPEGEPIWDEASVCDHRGGGGQACYLSLRNALQAAEYNAKECCFLQVDRVSFTPPRPQVRPE